MMIFCYYTLGPGGLSEMGYYGNEFARKTRENRYSKLFLWLLGIDILIVIGILR